MKRVFSPFGGRTVRLRLIEEHDLETTLAWRNRDDARVWFKHSDVIAPEQHRAWFQSYSKKDDDFLFVVEVENKPVGQASVYDIDREKRCAEVGRFLVAPDEGGKGYISEACGELVRFCTDRLGLHYIFLEVFETNERAVRLYERNGFTEECKSDGLIRMGLSLNPE